jgi:hypothetical protein
VRIWRWLLACQWHRLAQEEAFVARTAEVGDESGSAVTAARQVRDIIRLVLPLDRRYAPYQKWLGTAFARARHADGLPDDLRSALHARDVAAREAALGRAPPARVLMADRFTQALLDTVRDPALLALPPIGGVDKVVDSTDVLEAPAQFRRMCVLYPGVGRSPSA